MPLPLALPPADPGFEILISSQGMSQGLPITDGIQAFPRLTVRVGRVQAGVQWRNVDSPAGNGVAAIFAKYDRKIGQWQADATVRYRMRTGFTGVGRAASWEFSAGVRRSFGKAAILASADYSPEEFGRGQSFYAEISPSIAIGPTRISGGIGRRYRETDFAYTNGNLGVSRAIGKAITLDARLYATDRADRGDRYKSRLILSARVIL
jgi:hypothetical protein